MTAPTPADARPARARPTPASLHRRWTLACAAAELLGIGVAGATAVGLAALWPTPATLGQRLAVLLAMVAAGALEGAALGVLQGRVLRARLTRLRVGEWAGPTVAVAALGWLVGMAGPVLGAGAGGQGAEPPLAVVLAATAGLGLAAGLVFGAAQWLVLRHHAERAERWVAVNALGWALALPAIFAGASVSAPGWAAGATVAAGAAGGLLGGTLLGMVTGAVVRTLRPWVDEQGAPLAGRVCAVTGANRGIGLEVARGLVRMGARVVLLCRHEAQGSRAARALAAERPGRADVQVVRCDLASLASVREAAAELRRRFERLDVLVHNAGATFLERHLTEDGLEATLATDVVGPFLLTALLRDRLEAAHGRVVVVAGRSHRKGRLVFQDLHFSRRPYDWLEANAQAQLGRVLFVEELARRAPRLAAVAVHPGAVLTGAQALAPRWVRLLAHTLARPGFVRAELGALPVLRLVTLPRLHALSGRYVDRFTPQVRPRHPRLSSRLWRVCEVFTRPPRDVTTPLPAPSPAPMPHAL